MQIVHFVHIQVMCALRLCAMFFWKWSDFYHIFCFFFSYSFSVKFRIILFSIKSCVLFAIKCNMHIVKYCELCSQSHSIEMRQKRGEHLIWIAIRLTIKANGYMRERISENVLYRFEFISFFSSMNFSPRFDSSILQVFFN